MSITGKQKFVYAFIDSQNLNLGIKDQGWKLDFAKFRVYLKAKFLVEKAYLFIGYLPNNLVLYKNLSNSGYEVIFKPTLTITGVRDPFVKGNVDAELVLHTMIQKDNFSKAVVVSGDGDFHCLLEYLERQGKLGRLLIPNRKRYSRLLQDFGAKTDFLDNLKGKLKK